MTALAQLLQSLLRYRSAVGVAGLIVLVVLLILLQILQQPIFAPIDAANTAGLLSLIVRSVFWLAIVAVVMSGLAFILPQRLFIPVSRLEYAVSVFRMIDPLASAINALNDRYEPHTGFPYYSRQSDHPSFWPARLSRDRKALEDRYTAFFGRPDVQAAFAAARATAGDTSTTKVIGRNADSLASVVASARMFFNMHLHGDPDALVASIGEPMAREFVEIEIMRGSARDDFPNRVAIIRVHNAGPRTIRDATIEYEVAGEVYDKKIRAVSEGAEEPDLPFEYRLTIPKLLVGQTYDITIWYQYQSVKQRVFPDKTNFIQELTQGFTISNIAVASGGRVVFAPDLLKEVEAYERLYDGDGRRSDNPERELAALFAAQNKEARAAAKAYDEENKKAEKLSLDALANFAIDESQIDNIWVEFASPAGKRYCAVCVFAHPKGPYVLLSSVDRDEPDFIATRTELAAQLSGNAEEEVSDRSSDICSTIAVPSGFTRPAIITAFGALSAKGFTKMQASKMHYRKTKPAAAAG
jgi:hypothetical protein